MRCSHVVDAKARLREQVAAARARRPPAARDAAGVALAAHAPEDWLAASSIAAVASIADEPPTRWLLDRLRSRGVEVLLPVVAGRRLDWARYAGWERLESGLWETRQPAGRRLGPAALASVDVIVVPALAVDRRGHRLGRGGGYYDRALATAAAPAYAVVYDDEVVDELPVEPHDVPVAGALTPSGLVVAAA
jgi:5-formyltetrahydrofolate cyclo-ligase